MEVAMTGSANTSRTTSAPRRTVAAASFGNVLEIYDFIVYGIFAIPISKTFFPEASAQNALILTFLTFAAGFLSRPLGAFVLGRYADRCGRKKALSLTRILMALGTVVPALCPGYASIGIAAPLIVLMGRLIQGFSAGGEVGSVVAMLVENAPPSQKNFYASFQQASQGIGILLGGLMGLVLAYFFSESEMVSGAWRIAFFFGLLIGPVGWYIRRSIPETSTFQSQEKSSRDSFWKLFATNWLALLAGLSIMVFWTVSNYLTNYMTTYSVRELHLSFSNSYYSLISYGLVIAISSPLVARLADKIGAKKVILFGAGVSAVVAYPLFVILTRHPSVETLIAVQAILGVLSSCYGACASAFLAGLFPTSFRVTGVNIAYSVGVTIFGGFTPAAITILINLTGNNLVVGYYLAAAAAISCIGVLVFHKRSARF